MCMNCLSTMDFTKHYLIPGKILVEVFHVHDGGLSVWSKHERIGILS